MLGCCPGALCICVVLPCSELQVFKYEIYQRQVYTDVTKMRVILVPIFINETGAENTLPKHAGIIPGMTLSYSLEGVAL